MVDNRTVRAQLLQQAKEFGLVGRRGGFSVDFLQSFLDQARRPAFNIFSASLSEFREILDQAEQESDKTRLIDIRQSIKRGTDPDTGRPALFRREKIQIVKHILRSMETTKKSRGKQTWQQQKARPTSTMAIRREKTRRKARANPRTKIGMFGEEL